MTSLCWGLLAHPVSTRADHVGALLLVAAYTLFLKLAAVTLVGPPHRAVRLPSMPARNISVTISSSVMSAVAHGEPKQELRMFVLACVGVSAC